MHDSRGPRRFDSQSHPRTERKGTDDRLFAIRSHPGRWSNATLAACLTYPADYRESVEEWSELLDELEQGITHAEFRSSAKLAVARPIPIPQRKREGA